MMKDDTQGQRVQSEKKNEMNNSYPPQFPKINGRNAFFFCFD